jgi:hypothetical protein
MRAREFVTEVKKGKLSKRQQYSTKGLHVFTDTNFDRIYMLNRVMMAAAMSDGITMPDLPAESWAAKFNTAHPYTKQEHDMLMHAYKVAGVRFKDLNQGDLKSDELDSTHVNSPIKPFKGYKKK